jgi:RHS repeat-associated protein
LHSDHLGSVSLTTDASGNPLARQEFDAWGNLRSDGSAFGTLPTDLGYTGQRRDSYIKLVQMGARWYDPELGRWLSPDSIVPDPTNPQSLNRYAYVHNRPLNFTDPTGHCDANADHATDPCWITYNQIIGKDKYITYDPEGLSSWGLPELSHLLGWLQNGVRFTTETQQWTSANLGDVMMGLDLVASALGGKTLALLGLTDGRTLTFNKILSAQNNGTAPYWKNIINLNLSPYHYDPYIDITIHEIGHIVDYHARPSFAGQYDTFSTSSIEWRETTGWSLDPDRGIWRLLSGADIGFASNYFTTPMEDFAETFVYRVDQGKYRGEAWGYRDPSFGRKAALNVALGQ